LPHQNKFDQQDNLPKSKKLSQNHRNIPLDIECIDQNSPNWWSQ
jgi:hypothetical protein